MTSNLEDHGFENVEEMPDRLAHRRKVAERIALDTPEYAADDPSRKAKVPQVGFSQVGPELFGSGRGPHA
jgi:hypothetical protein